MITGFKVSTAVVIRVKLQGTFSLPGLEVESGDVQIEHDLGPNGELPQHLLDQLNALDRADILTAAGDAAARRPIPQQ